MFSCSCFSISSSAIFSVSLVSSVSQVQALVLSAGSTVIVIAFTLMVFLPGWPAVLRPSVFLVFVPGSMLPPSCLSASERSEVSAAISDRPAVAVAPRQLRQAREVSHSLPARSGQPSSAWLAPVPLGLAGRAESVFVGSSFHARAQFVVRANGSGHGFFCSSRRGESAASAAWQASILEACRLPTSPSK